jgi:hypothetical protein
MQDWDNFVRHAREKNHPLSSLSEEDIDTFGRSLVFRNGGLAGATYSDLVDKLTPSQFERLWAAFGISMDYLTDHNNYYCPSHGTCDPRTGSICTSNCFEGGE